MYVVYQYRENQSKQLQIIEGETMGTTYHIKYLGKENYKDSVDILLKKINQSLSTYIPSSEISQYNQQGKIKITSPYFYPVIKKSEEIYKNTNGAFDPTVMQLVNAWGFGFENKSKVDSVLIDSLLTYVSFSKITYDKHNVTSSQLGVMLDFSAIAKGYGVDEVASFLKSKKIKNFMVEIGGEVVCSGVNQEKKIWKIGIDNPKAENDGEEKISEILALNNKSLATSGNYRNYYTDSLGVKRAHTINPKTGYPVQHSLLSASVIANDCMTADGYATAMMVVGVEGAKEIINSIDEIEGFLIFDNSGTLETWSSEGFFNK